ncbi:MAG: hypothetical protein GX799_08025 [Crenarchaeota archaeon]|nr:hypothetical protein [Thermoproteota archaeon]
MVVLDVDLFAFKKDCEDVLLASVENYVNERLSSEETNSRKVVGDVDNYFRKVLIDTCLEFMGQEDRAFGSQFEQLVDEANEKMNMIISDVKQTAAQLFGFQVADVEFSVFLNFDTNFYYQLDPLFMVSITFSVREIEIKAFKFKEATKVLMTNN